MVYHVLIPKDIDAVAQAVIPVAREINHHKGNDPGQPRVRNLNNCQARSQKRIAHQHKCQAQTVFEHISDPATQAAQGIE